MAALSSLQKRILSAVILGPLTLWIIIAGGLPFVFLILGGAAISIHEWYRMEAKGSHVVRNTIFGVLYIGLCAAAFIKLRLGFEDGLHLVLAVLLSVWGSDIGAYFSGKAIGGPKLAPVLSPKKTWAGLIGGMFCSGLVLTVFEIQYDVFDAHTAVVFLTGFSFGIVGQAGDLLVSGIKRRVGVKDTGNIIPGHGGLLDRVDSWLLVIPVFLVGVMLWLN